MNKKYKYIDYIFEIKRYKKLRLKKKYLKNNLYEYNWSISCLHWFALLIKMAYILKKFK